MTHPKQLENVARAIYSKKPLYYGGEKVVPFEEVNEYYRATIENQAQAAIEAAFQPLPIEDAPKDGTPVLITYGDGSEYLLRYKDPYWRDANDDDILLTHRDQISFLPTIPTQEGE